MHGTAQACRALVNALRGCVVRGGGGREGMGASTAALCDTHYAQGMSGRGKELGHTHIDASDSSNLVAFPRRHVPEGASTLSA